MAILSKLKRYIFWGRSKEFKNGEGKVEDFEPFNPMIKKIPQAKLTQDPVNPLEYMMYNDQRCKIVNWVVGFDNGLSTVSYILENEEGEQFTVVGDVKNDLAYMVLGNTTTTENTPQTHAIQEILGNAAVISTEQRRDIIEHLQRSAEAYLGFDIDWDSLEGRNLFIIIAQHGTIENERIRHVLDDFRYRYGNTIGQQQPQDTYQRVVITIGVSAIEGLEVNQYYRFYRNTPTGGILALTVYRINRINIYVRNSMREHEYIELHASVILVPPEAQSIVDRQVEVAEINGTLRETIEIQSETHDIHTIEIPEGVEFSVVNMPDPWDQEIERVRNQPVQVVSTRPMNKQARVKQEFKVSELITLKLEAIGGYRTHENWSRSLETNIYINGTRFKQCKYLLLNIDLSTKEGYKQQKYIESIDEAKELLSNELEGGSNKVSIPPETEFWGHCSNLEAWVENDYDLRILHSNLSLPLLRELSKYDNLAKMRFKEQIIEKIVEGGYKAFITFKSDLKKFTREEIKELYLTLREENSNLFCDLLMKEIGIKAKKEEFVSSEGYVYTMNGSTTTDTVIEPEIDLEEELDALDDDHYEEP